jgi:cytochrome b involved in lipid metabolism
LYKFIITSIAALFLLTGCSSVESPTDTESNISTSLPSPSSDSNTTDQASSVDTLPNSSESSTPTEENSTKPGSQTQPADSFPKNSEGLTIYPIKEISKHNNQNDCWVIVNKKVHNLTTWIFAHPGGKDAILGICGTDATELFLYQHGGSSQPTFILSRSQIGVIE